LDKKKRDWEWLSTIKPAGFQKKGRKGRHILRRKKKPCLGGGRKEREKGE